MTTPKSALAKASAPSGAAASPPPVRVPPRAPTLTQPPPLPAEDDWESEPTRVEVMRDEAAASVAVAPKPPAALGAPIAPALPPASRALEAPLAKGDVQVLIHAGVEQAIAPMRPLLDLDRRVAELERRAAELERRATAANLAVRPSLALRAAPAPLGDSGLGSRFIDVPVHLQTVASGAELGPFDGRRRRRRLVIGLALALVVLFGSLFLLLAASYANTHT